MSAHPLNFKSMNHNVFRKKIAEQTLPLVVDFWAPWCTPCRITKPILEKLAAEYQGRVEFLQINADESRKLLEEYHITGIPTVIAFKDGKVAGRVTGARDEAGFRTMFEALAQGNDVRVPVRTFDRVLRLVTGAILVVLAIITRQWWLIAIGAVVAFLGVYDRCPIWAAITRAFKHRKTT